MANFTIDRTTKIVHTFTEDLGEGVFLNLVLIPPGEFLMGSPTDELEHRASEEPQHPVKIDNPFFMGQYPITQAQWRRVAKLPKIKQKIDPAPSRFKGDDLPVESVSWLDAQDEKIGDTVYPGRYGRGKFGEYRQRTTPVGSFGVANEFGLSDVHGNVWEWCEDHWHEN